MRPQPSVDPVDPSRLEKDTKIDPSRLEVVGCCCCCFYFYFCWNIFRCPNVGFLDTGNIFISRKLET